MGDRNPFHGPEQPESEPVSETPEPPSHETSTAGADVAVVPASWWNVAAYLVLIALLIFAAYSLVEQKKRNDALIDQLAARRAATEQAEARALQAETRNFSLEKQVGELEQQSGRLRREVNDLKTARNSLEQERQELIRARDEAAEAQRTLKDEMLAALESRDVTISELQGNLTLNILDRILFDSGQAVIKPEGEAVLRQIGELLDQVPNRQIHVLGHTDNIPIHTAAYPSNWELSSARALAAVRFLVDQAGVDPGRIAAVAHGEFQPVATNDTPEGRARNRRIAIVVLPEVFKVPEETIEPPPHEAGTDEDPTVLGPLANGAARPVAASEVEPPEGQEDSGASQGSSSTNVGTE